jgi:hypothetical protein
MNTQIALQQQAIEAAKREDWAKAAELNEALLTHNPADLGAMNRLGIAKVQLGDLKAATEQFATVLTIDKSNTIAKKHLAKLKSNQVPSSPSFSQIYFIEEPGKTKIAQLHRLAGKTVLEGLRIGQACELKVKNRFVSVESNGTYVGALPEDLSFRLTKLMKSGNEYACYVHSLTQNSCDVYIQEIKRSSENEFVHSFPPPKGALAAINDIDEAFLLDDEISPEVGGDIDGAESEVEDEKPFDRRDMHDDME